MYTSLAKLCYFVKIMFKVKSFRSIFTRMAYKTYMTNNYKKIMKLAFNSTLLHIIRSPTKK